MAAVAETDGSMTRTRAIAIKARHKGHEVALCAGEDINYRPIEGIINYYAPIPSPFSLPGFAGRKVFHVAKLAGIQQRITISDFEQVLYFIGHWKVNISHMMFIVCARRFKNSNLTLWLQNIDFHRWWQLHWKT